MAHFELSFTAYGIPKGQPRPRAFARAGRARVYDPGTAEAWKSAIAMAAKGKMTHGPFTGKVSVEIRHFMPRPKGHFGKCGLSPRAPKDHTQKPDIDNLVKAALDALTTIGMWRDDSQVTGFLASKIWAEDADMIGAQFFICGEVN